jgi:MFS family permease
MENETITEMKSPTLRASVRESAFYSIMVGAGESYLPAFGILLMASAFQIGILTTLPPVIGAISQCLGVWALDSATHRRSLVSKSAFLHGLIWIPIALIPFLFGFGEFSGWILIVLVCGYHAFFGFGVPIWNSLMGDLVPEKIRGTFFGYRNKIAGLMTFVSLAAAGFFLDLTTRFDLLIYGYLIIFLLSGWFRILSSIWLNKYDDPEYIQPANQIFSLWRFVRKAPRSNFAKFVFFVSLLSFAVNIAGPYFSVYMLRDLNFSYTQFMAITAMNIFAQFITIQRWGVFSDRFGNKKILTVSAFGVALCPLIWLFTDNFWIIFILHLYNGFVWAGFNLAAANFMFDAVTPPKRGRCSAYQAIITTFFVFLGSLLGGYIATHISSPVDFHLLFGLPESPYPFLFSISMAMRFLVVLFFLKAFGEVREVENIKHRELIFRITHIRPLTGATFSVVSSIFKK